MWQEGFQNDLKIGDTRSNRLELVPVNHRRMGSLAFPPCCHFGKKILVLGEEDAFELSCPVKKLFVGQRRYSVFLRGEDIDSSSS